MPTYTYECKKCEHTFDVFHAIHANPRVKCEECGGACKRLLGTGAGIIFKGSGFYETDYKRSGASKSSETSRGGDTARGGETSRGGEASSSSTSKGDGKTAAKTETKSKTKSSSSGD